MHRDTGMNRLIFSKSQQAPFAALLILLVLVALFACPPSRADVIRIATWNLEHLAEKNGAGCRAREAKDYALLRSYVAELDADVIAFQEVENRPAAERIFDPSEYVIEISGRRAGENSPCYQHSGRRQTPIKVGFAIRKEIAYERNADLTELANGRRHGVDITLYADQSALRLMTVHLASGCYSNTQDQQHDKDCNVLNQQIPFVEQWLDTQTREDLPAMALGDFNRRLTMPHDRVWADWNDAQPAPYALITAGYVQNCNGPYDGAPHIDHLITNHFALGMLRSRLMSLQFSEDNASIPSDHCPLTVDLEINRHDPAI